MKQKKRLTSKEFALADSYFFAEDHSVNSAYVKPSDAKQRIEAEILYRMKHDFNGYDYRVFSCNGFRFSCGFKIMDGDNKFLCICTPSKWYQIIPIETIDTETGEIHNWISEFEEYWKARKN